MPEVERKERIVGGEAMLKKESVEGIRIVRMWNVFKDGGVVRSG